MVEGSRLPTSCDDQVDNAFEVGEHVSRGHAESAKAECGDPIVASGIALDRVHMDFTVDLDREARLEARKIEAVAVQRVLTAKLETPRASAERTPQDNFREVAAAAFAAR